MSLLVKETYYGIRPYLNEYETLSSYLHRVADLNYESYEDIIRQVSSQTYKQFPSSLYKDRGYRIDLLPTINFNMDILAGLLKKGKSEILHHSLFNLFYKFEPKANFDVQFVKMCSKFYNTKDRCFCPICIKDNIGVYKLHWQFLWNDICEKHNCKLVNYCFHCNAPQKYIHPGLGKGLCSNCSKTLSGEIILVRDWSVQTKCNTFMNDFHFLLSPHIESFTESCAGYKNTSIAITLLYALQTVGFKQKNNDIKFEKGIICKTMNRGTLDKIIRFICGTDDNNFNINFPMLSNHLKLINMSFIDFSRILVTKEYINSIFEYVENLTTVPKEKPKCKFQFCSSYNSERMMFKQDREKIENKDGYYYSLHICMGCFIQYGYNKQKKSWEDISNIISQMMEIRNLLNEGVSPYKITEITSNTINKVYTALGFLLRHSLLGSKETEKYMKKVTSFENIKVNYNEIDRRRGNKAKEIIRKYRIHPINFYYNFFTPDVQKKVYAFKKDNNVKKLLLDQAHLFIKECLKSGEIITFKQFCKKYKVTLEELKIFGIHHTIQMAKVEQKKQLIFQKETELFEDVEAFINQNKGRVILVKEVCNYIGYSDRYMCRYFPVLYKKISELCNQRKIECFHRTITDLKAKVKQIVDEELRISGTYPKIGSIINELGLNKQFYRNYREVYEYCLELQRTFKNN